MEDPNKKVGQGCFNILARTVVVRLISAAVVLILAVLSCIVTFSVASVKGGTFGLITGTIFFAVFLFGGGCTLIFITIYRRKIYLDKAFTPLGLTGSIYHLWFRRYVGQIQGRKVEVYFHRGPDLQIFIETNLKTRMGASPAYADTMFFAKLTDSTPLKHNISNLQNLSFWADESAWVQNLISQMEIQQILLKTLNGQDFFVRSFINLIPNMLKIHFNGNTNLFSWELPPEQIRDWFSDAFKFLEIAENQISRPQKTLEMSSAESIALSVKRKDITKLLIGLAVGMVLFFLIIGVGAFLFVSLVG